MFQALFHTILTSQASDYAPPDTGSSKFATSCRRIPAINRRCRPGLLVCTFLHWILLFCTHQRLPFQGPILPIRGKCPEGTKGVGMLSPKVTERLLQICGDLSVSAFRRATSPGRGRLGERTPMASPMRGSCRRRRLMRWGQLRRRRSVHLIRHGSAVPPSPRRGRHGAAPAQKKRPSRSGRALGMGAYSV